LSNGSRLYDFWLLMHAQPSIISFYKKCFLPFFPCSLSPPVFSLSTKLIRVANLIRKEHFPVSLPGAFVDSGTTFTLLPEAAFASIRTYLQTNFCHLPLVCAHCLTPRFRSHILSQVCVLLGIEKPRIKLSLMKPCRVGNLC